MKYYMQSNGMYVTNVDFSIKERISMNKELSNTDTRSVRVKTIKVSSGRSEAIKFSEFDGTDHALMGVLKTLGYKRESVTDPDFAIRLGGTDWNWKGSLEI